MPDWSEGCVPAKCGSSAGLWWMLAYMYAGTGGIVEDSGICINNRRQAEAHLSR